MPYNPVKGDTLLIPSGPEKNNKKPYHLFIILTDEAEDSSHLLVSVSSVKADGLYYDNTAILLPGCHSCIRKESFIYYNLMRPYKHDSLVKNVVSGVYIPKERFAEPIFRQICAGVERSESSSSKMIAYFQKNR